MSVVGGQESALLVEGGVRTGCGHEQPAARKHYAIEHNNYQGTMKVDSVGVWVWTCVQYQRRLDMHDHVWPKVGCACLSIKFPKGIK